MKAFTRSWMLKDARIARGVSRVVSNTMARDMPSTPRWKVEWIASYQT